MVFHTDNYNNATFHNNYIDILIISYQKHDKLNSLKIITDRHAFYNEQCLMKNNTLVLSSN